VIVHKLKVSNFFGFKSIDVELPPTGLTVVTGQNGKGKTARYITAPSWCGWGETERGTPPYVADGKPNVSGTMELTVKGQRVTVTRKWSGRSKDVSFTVEGQAPTEYSTTSKAQAALDGIIGDYMTWRRTHIFSGADAALFSTADDATRKRLLEQMLQLDIFDGPLKAAREELRGLQTTRDRLYQQASGLAERRKLIVQQARDVKELVGSEVIDVERLDREVEKAQTTKRELAAAQQKIQQDVGRAQAALNQAQAELRKVGDGTCRTCGQPLPHADVAKHQAAVAAAQAAAEEAQAAAAESHQKVREDLRAIEAALQDMLQTKSRARTAVQAEAKLEKYRADAAELKQQVQDLELSLIDIDYDLHVLEHAIQILSTKGVRAVLLGRALASLTDLTNAYLERLRPGVTIELSPTSETKGGKVVDTISLNVHGMGGGWGYKATSGGERKRIDIALLLALSTLSGSEGTLIFDEAMDAIDDAGVEAVSALLLDVSKQRPVVIITHNAALAESLSGAQRVTVK
jgi:DNA repair exonuclease SbcCD ATPase subunit